MFFLFVGLCAVFVYYDATKNKIGRIPDAKGFTNMSAGQWSVGVLLLWIVIFPLYLFKRSGLIDKANENPQVVKWKGAKITVLVIFSLIPLLVGSYNGYLDAANSRMGAKLSQSAPVQSTSLYSHEKIRALVANKAQQEVIKILGRPDETMDLDVTKIWIYFGISKNVITGKTDDMVQVHFTNGRVSSVAFL